MLENLHNLSTTVANVKVNISSKIFKRPLVVYVLISLSLALVDLNNVLVLSRRCSTMMLTTFG